MQGCGFFTSSFCGAAEYHPDHASRPEEPIQVTDGGLHPFRGRVHPTIPVVLQEHASQRTRDGETPQDEPGYL